MHKYRIWQILFLLCFFVGAFGDAEAVSHRQRKYINYDANKKYGLHVKKKKAVQPKHYIALGMSYPTHIDISNRAKHNDIYSGVALSKPKKSFFYNVAAGKRSSFNDQVAFEVEAMLYRGRSKRTFMRNGREADNVAKLESLSFFLNSYYIFDGWAGFHPFIGAGVGASYNNVHERVVIPKGGGPALEEADKSKIAPAFQVMLGMSKNLSKSIDVQAKVKAMSLGKFSLYNSEGRFSAVALSGDVGIKYSFDHFKKIRHKAKRD